MSNTIHLAPPTYKTIKQYFHEARLFHRDADQWRLTLPIIGEIHALPGSHGILTATNGMLCHILQGHDSAGLPIIFVGHIDNFIRWNGTFPDEIHLTDGTTIKPKQKPRSNRIVLDLLTELHLA